MQEVMPNTLIVLPMAPLALIIDRLHVTAVRWVVQFCFLVLQGQTSGKKRRAHQQAIYNGCVVGLSITICKPVHPYQSQV
jgi:hypothetical protein